MGRCMNKQLEGVEEASRVDRCLQEGFPGSGPRAPEAGNPSDVFRDHQGAPPRASVVGGDREVVRDGSVPKGALSKRAATIQL